MTVSRTSNKNMPAPRDDFEATTSSMSDTKTSKKIRPGSIEADPDELAIIVNYDVEIRGVGDYGERLVLDKKKDKKKVNLKTLTAQTNIPQLAEHIVEKCKLIPASKIPLVETLLYQLQKRCTEEETAKLLDGERDLEGTLRDKRKRDARKEGGEKMVEDPMFGASILSLEEYIENLYDEMEQKIKGTFMILQLTRSSDNLEPLIQNEILLGALSRTLREDGKRSMDLVIHIVTTFYVFSMFSQFHPIITQYQIGDVVLKIIALEIQRIQIRHQGLNEKPTKKERSGSMLEDTGKEARKIFLMQKKQDRLLHVCFNLLLNLAEDIGIEQKMKKRNIVRYLVSMLDRDDYSLLVMAVTFLKKLSIFQENKVEMVDAKLVSKLIPYVPCHSEVLTSSVIRLLFNLSFDPLIREEIGRKNLIPSLVDLLKKPSFRTICLKLLYHLSMVEENRPLFANTDAIPLILQMIVNFPDVLIGRELAALAVNLAADQRNAELFIERDGLKLLMTRVERTRDPLLMKIIRMCCQHDINGRRPFLDFFPTLAKLCVSADSNPDLLVEVIGVLGRLPIGDFGPLLVQNRILEFLQKFLVAGFSEDDIVLEVIIFIGNIATDGACAPHIVKSRVLGYMYQLLTEKQEDDEFVLQILYAFYTLIFYQEVRDALLSQTQLVTYLVDLMYDKNPEVCKLADLTLDVILEFNEDQSLLKRIRQRKFQAYNQEWLEAIEDDGTDVEPPQTAASNATTSSSRASLNASLRSTLGVPTADGKGGRKGRNKPWVSHFNRRKRLAAA